MALILHRCESAPPGPFLLFAESFLRLADFLLDLPTDLFGSAFRLQTSFICRASDGLFHFAFHFVEGAFRIIFGASPHLLSPFSFVEL
jgi:hypothetical protein